MLDETERHNFSVRMRDGTVYLVEQYGRRWIRNRLTGELYETDEDDDSEDGDYIYTLTKLT